MQGAQPDDIIEQLIADHRRIHRLAEAMYDVASDGTVPDWVLVDAWRRLADLLEVHTWAEEEICYLPMFGSGLLGVQRRREAVSCHDDIRDAISDVSLRPVGSPPWWRAVQAVLNVAVEHFGHEEHVIQTSWAPRLTPARRRELGRQWSSFIAALRSDVGPTRAPRRPLRPAPARVHPLTQRRGLLPLWTDRETLRGADDRSGKRRLLLVPGHGSCG